jgi:hypothetical protein
LPSEPVRLPDLRALSRRPLLYADPEHAASVGLPPLVRGASSAALAGGALVVVQRHLHALARVDLSTGLAAPLLLPTSGAGGGAIAEGNSAELGACALLPGGTLLVLGAGSGPRSEVAVEAGGSGGKARSLRARHLYSALKAALPAEAGELCLDGVAVAGDITHFLHRGHAADGGGAGGGCALLQAPTAEVLGSLREGRPLGRGSVRARNIALGAIDGAPLSWSDGLEVYRVGLVFTANARGPSGAPSCALGVYGRDGSVALARLLDVDGSPLLASVEGLALAGDRAWLVTGSDAGDAPADLVEVPFGLPAAEAGERAPSPPA